MKRGGGKERKGKVGERIGKEEREKERGRGSEREGEKDHSKLVRGLIVFTCQGSCYAAVHCPNITETSFFFFPAVKCFHLGEAFPRTCNSSLFPSSLSSPPVFTVPAKDLSGPQPLQFARDN